MFSFKKVIAAILTLSTLFSFTSVSAFASSNAPQADVMVGKQSMTIVQDQNAPVVQEGVRSYILKQAVKLLASAFRNGGDILEYCLKWLDDDAAAAAARYSDDIADELDFIASIPDLVVGTVKDKIYYFMLNQLGLSGGTSLMIADAIATTLNWLVL